MAIAAEAPALPTVDPSKAEQGASPGSVKPTRIRNEYPEAYDELEELERSPSAKPAPKETPKAEAAPKPAADKNGVGGPPKTGAAPAKPADKPAETDKPSATDKPTDKPVDKPDDGVKPGEPDPTAKFATAHDLRKDWRRLHKAVEEKEQEITTLRAKIEKAPINNAVLEENKALKKRLDEVEGELRYVDYTKSAEFKEKFEKPYQDAYDDALEEVKELQVASADGQTRPATAHDFQRILETDSQDVRRLATEMFGDAANDVLSARRRLIELNKNANRESKRFREQAQERERQRTLKQVEEKEQMEKLWTRAVESIKEKYPEYFAHREGDDDYNKELDAGYAVVDKAHAPGIPMEEKIARLAALRHRAAAFRPLVFELNRAKARITELEEVVKEYEKSAPSGGQGGSEAGRVAQGGEDGSGYKSAEDEIDALARLDTTEA